MVYKTPGVYVEEISTLPPSVAGVATAIPAFLGYTEKGPANTPTRISTMLEYEATFGGASPTSFQVSTQTVDDLTSIDTVTPATVGTPDFTLYYHMKLFFNNGGGACYIISVGTYGNEGAAPAASHFETGLGALEKEDEPTLILLTDAVKLSPVASYYGLCEAALAQCKKLGDRFCILDILDTDPDGTEFRNSISLGTDDLKYGAAYAPYLSTSIPAQYNERFVTTDVTKDIGSIVVPNGDANGLRATFADAAALAPKLIIQQGSAGESLSITTSVNGDGNPTLTIRGVGASGVAVSEILSVWNSFAGDRMGFEIEQNGDGSTAISELHASPGADFSFNPEGNISLYEIKSSHTSIYNAAKLAIGGKFVNMPPSGAVAGIYAKVDRERGVWKSPANVGIASVIAPTVKYTFEDQENLNVDATAGKSINAIRSFAGKGTLIWGGRTLAGNDNEWRYINVRRLFNMIEESIKKATSFAVFEPNDATTWLKVKAMIDSYLYGLWQQGALAGPAPASAYFINVGLGKTMTTQDVLEGRMIVEIGIAAVRPAEFIILRFSHKLQEA